MEVLGGGDLSYRGSVEDGEALQLLKLGRGPCLCCSGNKGVLLLWMSNLLGSLNLQNCQIALGA